MSSPYVKLGSKTLDQWKVTELKEELKRRKLATKGLKEDLVKRLDEAVRGEMVDSMDKEDNDSPESNLPLDQANTESNVSERANDSVDKEIDIIEKGDAKPENEVDATGEDKAVEADLVLGNKADGLEAEQVVQISAVETTVMVSETVEPVIALSGSHSESLVTNDDGVSTTLLSSDGYPQEDAEHKSLEPNTQSTQANESSMPVTPPGEPNLVDSNTQEEATHSTDSRVNDDFKCSQTDSIAQPLKYQVSEVNSDSEFQVTSDSVSTASVSIIEKNELKIDVIPDNVQLELDVKHEMVQPSPSSAAPDVGESHPMDVEEPLNKNDLEEPLDTKDFQEPVQKKEYTEAVGGNDPVNGDSFKSFDSGDMGHPEKLNLDRSSGDDSMEEDILESKQMEDKSDTSTDNVGKSEIPIVKEDEHVDVVGHDKPAETKIKPVEIKITDADNEIVSAPTPGKRKFQDKEAVVNNDTVKKVRRWNAEGLKTSEPQSVSLTPKGGLPELSFKPVSETDSTVNAEVPKERQVPAPSRPPSNSLRIDRFLRPFTLKAVQELLGKTGTVTSFWMDHIKTHCYVSYASVEEAVETRNAVYNLQWPPNGGRFLVAEFVDPQEVKSRVEAPPASPATPSTSVGPSMPTTQHQPAVPPQPSPRQQVQRQPLPPPTLPPPPLSNPPPIRDRLHPPREQPLPARDRLNLPPPPPLPEKVDLPIVTLDDLFRKTKATPRIYYLPLSDEQVSKKLETQGKNVNQ